VADLRGLAVERFPLADRAGHTEVRQKVHLDSPHALPLALLAPPALHVEAESPGLEAEAAGVAGAGEYLGDLVERDGAGGGVESRAAGEPQNC
jgi:hypothetical protein